MLTHFCDKCGALALFHVHNEAAHDEFYCGVCRPDLELADLYQEHDADGGGFAIAVIVIGVLLFFAALVSAFL